jgi:ABC-type lipoprotein release transport system permease subunit
MMTLGRLVLRSLFYHWRGNLAVLLGVSLGTAVLTGALLVGDSLRGSLRDVALDQLGWVGHALVSGRFFREKLADELGVERVAPAILLQGSASIYSGGTDGSKRPAVRRAGRVTILGVDDRFWSSSATNPDSDLWSSDEPEIVINQALADALSATRNDKVTLHLQTGSDVPRESFLGRRDVADILATVRQVIPSKGLGRFNLSLSAATSRNAFVPLRLLQKKLGQAQRVNALLVGGGTTGLQETMTRHLTLDDWGLIMRTPQGPEGSRNYLSLQSRQLLLDPVVSDAALQTAKEMGLTAAPMLVYLANTISDGKNEIPYSVVAALDPKMPAPLGPFLPPRLDRLKEGEIVLADWKESPLRVQPGSTVTLTYFPPEESEQARERTTQLTVRGFLPLSGVAADPALTPEFPGITDKLDIRKWDPPFPYDNTKIKPRDERYWKEHRTTPKAYVTLAQGQKLWGSRFGNLTSIRLAFVTPNAAKGSEELSNVADRYVKRLLAHMKPERGGMIFENVRERALAGSVGSSDFRWLFLGFSFFLIAAGILLVALLFRLHLDRRAPEIGVLAAAGYRLRTIRGLLLAEGGIVAFLGACLGLGGAMIYGWLVLQMFGVWWPGGLERSFLGLHLSNPMTFVYGYLGSCFASMATVAATVRRLGRVPTPALLAGETTAPAITSVTSPRKRYWVAIAASVGAVIMFIAAFSQRNPALMFFFTGAFLLIFFLAVLRNNLMMDLREPRIRKRGKSAIIQLGIRNAARHPARSILTAGLIAAATFLIVAIEAFRKSAETDFDIRYSSGQFTLMAESDLPIYQDLNAKYHQDSLGLPAAPRVALWNSSFLPFRLRPGDDTSCLNLYQPRKPRILGIPADFGNQAEFRFKDSMAAILAERIQPSWGLLKKSFDDGAIPAIGDANTVQWILHLQLGQDLEIEDDKGAAVGLRIVGTLQDSIFQSELLISEANFLRLFPREEGYRFFLIKTSPKEAPLVRSVLETDFADRGLTVTPTAERLAAYLDVENTYLATFQALGGLGLVLGALGLGVVLIRTVWERRGELALLRALGYRESALGWLIMAENTFLLALGLGIGTVSALITSVPQIMAGVGHPPWLRLAGLLLVVLSVGIAVGWAALMSSLRAPLLQALRRE